MNKRFFMCLAIILLTLFILPPLITYSTLTNAYNSAVASYSAKENRLQQQINSLTEQNSRLTKENSQLTNLSQPFLISKIGYYLHKSNDQYSYSRNQFTIYGIIYNIGNSPANNTELTIKFYDSTKACVQTSTLHLGVIQSVTNSTGPYSIGTENIDCSVADTVADIDIQLHYQ